MKLFLVQRTDIENIKYGECFEVTVYSWTDKHAEKYARTHIWEFKKAKLRVKEIDGEKEHIFSIINRDCEYENYFYDEFKKSIEEEK